MITVRNVVLRRGAKVVLDGASFTLNPGEKAGLVGRNGAGKSSLFALLTDRLHADRGDVDLPPKWRVGEVARLLVDAGLIVVVAFISPFRAERQLARSLFEPGEFIEVFVDTPLEECERRDVKGLYAKARRGELKNFTGIDSEYEPPTDPEIHLRTVDRTPESSVDQIIRLLRE